MRRTVQVGLAPLAEMELRVSTKAVIYPVSFFPGEFAGYEDIGGVRMVKVRFSPEMHPGEVFTQEWVFDTINMYSEEYNAAIVSPRIFLRALPPIRGNGPPGLHWRGPRV